MENITPKQLEIINLLYRFRFLNRHHLQTLLNHKSPRRLNTWLKDLSEQNIIGRKYSHQLLANTKPAIYYLATKAIGILRDQPDINPKLLKRVYRERTRSEKFINHCLLLADFYLSLREQTQAQQLHFFTKTDLSTHYYLPYQRPDAYIAITDKNHTKRYFLEIIDQSTPRFLLRQKIEQYFNYFESQKWQSTTNHEFPNILLLLPDEKLKEYLSKYLSQKLEEEIDTEVEFYLSLSNQLPKLPWEKVS